MDARRSELGQYLRARRALVQPEDVGLTREPGRRVDGLRREEVARLAGISPEYYLRLERGRDHQPSDQVLVALGRALRLDHEAVDYLRRLAHAERRRPEGVVPPGLDDSVRSLLAQWSHTPAFVMDRNQDIILSNALASALGPGYMEPGANLVLQMFSEASRQHAADWDRTAHRVVAALRLHAEPEDPRLQEIVGTLTLQDPDFARIWARHDVAVQRTGVSRHWIDPIGWVEFRWQNLSIPGSSHVLVTFWADPGTPAAAAVAYLAAQVQQGTARREPVAGETAVG
ncbi:helix-turn-helix transcriptional regulator [Curtobacterium flaccumfaciens pv. flaccumfaciens]|uniref:helix-turn-helix domain-containing protein n=1 Tax=Curtobacterium flaccumfaciens TaxID=2035 RepID=UPI00217D2C89|nr:helix-turn-helix transcriptional regulator [Curtobacterium flaccumfaciens]MCS6547890.1 helix-turn-helix transcriptional regulator [Curtobacterium flaccumfaciens pv. flaccumfaciens]